MLSHLRFHRRGPSTPASPNSDQHPTSPSIGHSSSFPPDVLSPDLLPTSSSSSALPPSLPPIARVTSDERGQSLDNRQNAWSSQLESRPQQTPKSPFHGGTSFIGGLALKKYRRDMETQAYEAIDGGRGLGLMGQYSASQPVLASSNPSVPTRPPPQALRNTKTASSFSTPTELQNSTTAPTGRRPAGTRLHTDLPVLGQTTSNTENPKPRKGLPFLKNPMSTLLMRRKNSQHAPDLHPLPLTNLKEELIYDPRIKGTRVHDFSAPRPKKNAPSKEPTQPSFTSPVPGSATTPGQERFPDLSATQPENAPVEATAQRVPSNASESIYSQDSRALRNTPSTASTAVTNPAVTASILTDESPPPVPPKNEAPVSVQPRFPLASRLIDDDISIYTRSTASLRNGRSRGPSLSGMSGKDIPSAVPRHMKSTSSRFSFDMIGAAKQEKLLEDRHRQRELEKKTTDTPGPRDSRFDDFDDDGFDYDAMMDDDGLEEKIPGVNADYEDDIYEEEIPMVGEESLDDGLDPDDDQENFSGFVFQRSNPTSSLASPHSAGFVPTPRDADGNTIGFAMSQYTPGLPGSLSPSLPLNPQSHQEMQPGGLGIQGIDVPRIPSLENEAAFQKNQELPPFNIGRSLNDDDLYFEDGMLGFENEFAEDLAAPPEWDDTPFDESIFDNNDTDQFGRPIAGAFAQAQSQMRETKQDDTKRESDVTSQLSVHSAASHSTAHTSPSVEGKQNVETDAPKDSSGSACPVEPSAPQLPSLDADSMAAYQAALAAAAYNAAVSGKFQRGSSPSPDDTPLSEASRSPGTPGHEDALRDNEFDGYDGYDDYGQAYEDIADFELDDDPIIAEANASALANDCDGWYGQEFGFYSAPTSQHHGPDDIDYEFANGGFFGPKGGLDRTTSGHMVSREPNLTPITERSEYSNRNSFMSLNMAGLGGGTPLQSPGLAQLALMGDRGDEMSLSALLRLRSRAWGGSQVSLNSSQNGSPRSERGDLSSSPWGPTFQSPTTFHARKNSVLSTISHDSDDNISQSGSPTLTGGISGLVSPPPPVPALQQPESDMQEDTMVAPLNVSRPTSKVYENSVSPVSDPEKCVPTSALVSPVEPSGNNNITGPDAARMRPSMGHRHKGSADSISYTKEEDSGATRWVMERRRTGESGQVEVLGREVVEGGRI
ncbi:hypothetical protein FZEAL_2465 [Fusarium zealandicum]|uniref:AGC-kinase C-terminal domain-containing protein n=1 Tax=Fusarium zealandicum TaxID=1053134 RepID=A0A8H4XMQ6_9HYPO|nr:hypothetical protein FZEAL_2465 [Fusarium zealandicum]